METRTQSEIFDYSSFVDPMKMLDEILKDFSIDFENRLSTNLKNRKIVATGQTLESLRTTLKLGIESTFKLSFQDHASILSYQWNRNPATFQNPRELALWVVENMNKISFMYNGKPARGQKGSATRIGFAIALSKQKLGRERVRWDYRIAVKDAVYGEFGLMNTILNNITEKQIKDFELFNKEIDLAVEKTKLSGTYINRYR